MKKSDLKKAIKPLVKECINEILIEEGLLASIVTEVNRGLQAPTLMESAPVRSMPEPAQRQRQADAAREKIMEHKRKLMDSIGSTAYNGVDLFENTTPISTQQESTPRAGSVDLGNPGDAGVDIGALMGNASKIWDAMK